MEQNATFRKNKLLDIKDRMNMLNSRGFMSQELEYRKSGRTTGLAIHAIGMAMTAPGQPVVVQDHHSTDRRDTDRLKHVIETVLCLLKLEHFKVEVIELPAMLLKGGSVPYAVSVRYEVFAPVQYKF